jgi:hypothetical protein
MIPGDNYTMCVFDVDQWQMIKDICEITSSEIEEVIRRFGSR